ncbi:MAG: S9 family peptidase [Dysgonomonas sp.]
MKKSFILLLSTISIGISAQSISIEDITSRKYAPKSIGEMTPAADGEHYFTTDARNSMIIKYAYKTGAPVDTVFNTKKARECDFDSFEGFLISPDEKRLLVYKDAEGIYRRSFKANYYYYDTRRNHVRKLTENPDKQMCPVFSKDGRMLAYVTDNNIWLAKFDFDTESQVTKDGEAGKIINGAVDWVYEEEFGLTSLMDFSQDNTLLAFVKFDETKVPEFSFQYYAQQLYPSLFSFKYPKPGEHNSVVTCNVFDIQSKTIREMNVPKGQTEYIPRIEFVNENELAVMTLNREQNNFNLYFANPRSTVSKLILNEKSDRYIDNDMIYSFRFFDNQFAYLSEKSGFSHIYLYSNAGVQQRQLTSGNYDVTALYGVDFENKNLIYQAADESPLRRSVFKVDLKKGDIKKLSEKTGYNSALLCSGGKYYVNTWNDSKTPSLVTLNETNNGKQIRVFEDNKELSANLDRLNIAQKEFITVQTSGGTQLNGWILKPSDFNAGRKYPLVMVQYSGPNSQMVLDKFSIDWEYYLANQGFIVACVDGRGTGARGEEFRKCTYMNLGIKESDDQIEAAKYFGTLPYVDSNRIAIWGWSYGGYNVLMSMSRGNVFKAGVAIAPVTDWRFYDSVYTERFMRTPQQNMSGYDAASAIKIANKLHGNLLLIHGSADDNVHFQNTMEYANALIAADKQFDMVVFPDREHSILGSKNRTYLYKKVVDYFKKNL